MIILIILKCVLRDTNECLLKQNREWMGKEEREKILRWNWTGIFQISQIKTNLSIEFLNRNREYSVIQCFMPKNSSVYLCVYYNYAYMIHNYEWLFERYKQKKEGKRRCQTANIFVTALWPVMGTSRPLTSDMKSVVCSVGMSQHCP